MNSTQFISLLQRQKQWSLLTFGPGEKIQSGIHHIRKELREIQDSPHDPIERIDIILLSMDRVWRTGCPFDYISKKYHELVLFSKGWRLVNLSTVELLDRMQKEKDTLGYVSIIFWLSMMRRMEEYLQSSFLDYTEEEIFWMVYAKQLVNFHRKWPAPVDEDICIEHIRDME